MTLPPKILIEIIVELEGIIIKMTYISNEIGDQLLPCSTKLLDKSRSLLQNEVHNSLSINYTITFSIEHYNVDFLVFGKQPKQQV